MQAVTIFAPIKLAEGKTEADLLAASAIFQTEFVAHEPGVLRREIVRDPNGGYIDIVQFRSAEDVADIMKKEMESPVCRDFFSVMDIAAEPEIELYPVLASY